MSCPYILLPLAQVFGYNLDIRYTSRPKSYRFNRPRQLRPKSNKLYSSTNTRKRNDSKTKNDTRKSGKTKKDAQFKQEDQQKAKNTLTNNRILSDNNVISSSSGKIIDIINSSEIVKTNAVSIASQGKRRKFSNYSSRRAKLNRHRKILKRDVRIPQNDESEITGLFPYLLNSIRESKSPEERSSSNYFSSHSYKSKRKSCGVIYTLNLPENQIPQISDREFKKNPTIPSVSPSVIFGQKHKSADSSKHSASLKIPTPIGTKTKNGQGAISKSKTGVGNEPPGSAREKNKQPKQLVPISRMLKEKSGLGPEIVDLDQSLYGLRTRETGNFESDLSIWSARNSVRELLTEVIGPYKIPPKIQEKSPVIEPKNKNPPKRTKTEKPKKKLKGILKPPTPRFYYDRMKDTPEDNIINKDVKKEENKGRVAQITHRKQHPLSDDTIFGESDNGRWNPSYNHLSERRVQVDKLIGNISEENG